MHRGSVKPMCSNDKAKRERLQFLGLREGLKNLVVGVEREKKVA